MADYNPMQIGYLGNGPDQNPLAMPFQGMQGFEGIGNNQFGYDPGQGSSMFQGIGQGLGAFTSLANIYGMFKSLGLQQDAFKFAQKGTKKNFNASATGFNNQVDKYNTAREASASYNGRDLNSLSKYAPKKIDRWD